MKQWTNKISLAHLPFFRHRLSILVNYVFGLKLTESRERDHFELFIFNYLKNHLNYFIDNELKYYNASGYLISGFLGILFEYMSLNAIISLLVTTPVT